MSEETPVGDLDFSDAELIELIKDHGIDRRSVMKVLGIGTALSLSAGSAAALHDRPHVPLIDSHYGYAAPEDERLFGPLRPDHTVELHADETAIFDEDPTTLPFHFEPMGLQVEEGDVIRFDVIAPEHTITAYHEGQGRQQRVPDDNPPFSSPVLNAGAFWLYEFDSPGTYDLLCAPHETFGMVMRLVVGDPNDPGYDGSFGKPGPTARPPESRSAIESFTGITSWPFPTPAEVFDTAALTVSNIVSSGQVGVSDVEDDL